MNNLFTTKYTFKNNYHFYRGLLSTKVLRYKRFKWGYKQNYLSLWYDVIAMKEFLTLVLLISSSFACENVKQYEDGEICVCSENYCDNVPELLISDKSNYQLFTTSKRRTGFHTTIGDFIERNENVGNKLSGDVTIEIMPNKARRERIIGFGGSFTDSTGINVMQLPEKLQKHFLDSYFGGNGIGYTLCRLPIGGSDFSTRAYSYCDVEGDEDLEHFKLQPEDFNYKVLKRLCHFI